MRSHKISKVTVAAKFDYKTSGTVACFGDAYFRNVAEALTWTVRDMLHDDAIMRDGLAQDRGTTKGECYVRPSNAASQRNQRSVARQLRSSAILNSVPSQLPEFKPMPLFRRPAPFSHPEWVYEIKHDGFRALAYLENGSVRLVSRCG